MEAQVCVCVRCIVCVCVCATHHTDTASSSDLEKWIADVAADARAPAPAVFWGLGLGVERGSLLCQTLEHHHFERVSKCGWILLCVFKNPGVCVYKAEGNGGAGRYDLCSL